MKVAFGGQREISAQSHVLENAIMSQRPCTSQRPRLQCAGKLLLVSAVALGAVAPSQAAGPFQFHSLTPCRVFDTRQVAAQTNGQPLPNPGPHLFRIQGNCGVPNGAAAVTANVTIVQPTRPGDLRLAPAGIPAPTVSTLNFNAGEPALANGAIVPLAGVAAPTDDDLAITIGMGGSGTVHVLLDVTGYFQ